MDLVAVHTARHPGQAALIEGERSLTWEEFFRTRNRLAHSLAALGIAAGQHAVVYAHNSLENLIAGAALRALGAIAVPMNHRLTAEEVAYILDNAEATAVLAGDAFLPMAERVRDAARVKHWITLGAERRPWAEALDDLLARGSEAPPPAPPAIGGSMVYTAGTTGKPKGALRRVTDPAAILPRLAALDCLDPVQVHLVAGPLYHSAPGGFALYAQMVGGTVVVMRKFDPLARHRRRAVPHAREGAGAGDVRARALRVLRLDRARREHRAASRGRAAQARLVRPRRARRRAGHPRRRRPPRRARHARRAVRAPLRRRVRRVLPQPGGHGADLARRVDVGGRRGLDGRRALRLHLRPQAGHDHLGRREHLPGRDRGRPAPSSRRRGRRRLRSTRSGVGRARPRRRPAPPRPRRHAGRAAGILPRAPRRLQDAARGVFPRGVPARHRRQARQAPPPRALLGRSPDARVDTARRARELEARHGFAGARRALGVLEERPGFCRGAAERWGVWGAISGPPIEIDALPRRLVELAAAQHAAQLRGGLA